MTAMNSTRYLALVQYLNREGHLRVPDDHLEPFEGEMVSLGREVANLRGEYRSGDLDDESIRAYEAIGFQWAPRGPKREVVRDAEIKELRRSGLSLAVIGEKYGLSRQRVHQILKRS